MAHAQQDREDERLVRPSPDDKPPRRDLRRERVHTEDDASPDDPSDAKDRSKNYKNIGGSLRDRVVQAAKDRIPAKNRETGETVQISPDTLKKEPGKYEPIDDDEEEGGGEKKKPEAPEKPKKEPEHEEESDKGDRDAYYQKAGDALRALAKGDAKLESKLNDFSNPGSQLSGMAKENPDFPADKILPGVKLPPGVKTLGDLKEALSHSSKPKPEKKKKPKEPAQEPKSDEPEEPAEPAEETKEAPKPKKKPKPKEEEEGDDEEPSEDGEEEAPEPSETQKAGIPDPQRRPVNAADREEAVNILASTFPPNVASELMAKNMHPDDVKSLVGSYRAAMAGGKSKDPAEIASKVREFYTTDPAKVRPPLMGKTKDGHEASFDMLSPEEKAESARQHQLRTVALSLAAHDLMTAHLASPGHLTGKDRVPRQLASALASVMLSKEQGNPQEVAANAFDNTLKSGSVTPMSDRAVKRLLQQVSKNPTAHAAAKAYLQANDYGLAKQKFLQGKDEITEWQNPREILKGLQKTGKFFDQRNALYGDVSPHPSNTFFRIRVMNRLRALDPQKAAQVEAQLPKLEEAEYREHHKAWQTAYKKWAANNDAHQKAVEAYMKNPKGEPPGEFTEPEPVEPKPPVKSAESGGEDVWQGVFEPKKAPETHGETWKVEPEDKEAAASAVDKAWGKGKPKQASLVFTYPAAPVMGPAASKTSVYHGVDPYGFGPPVYPGWLQPHQRDLGALDYKLILGEAQDWLKSPLLTSAVDGMVPDAKYRSALDLAIYASPYNGGITANVYNKLLAELAGKPEPGRGETLLTIRDKTAGHSYEVATMTLLVYGPHPGFNVDAKNDLYQAYFPYKDDEGKSRDDGHCTIRDIKNGPFATRQDELKKLVQETVVTVDYPKGAEDAALKAVQKALRPRKLKVEKTTANHKPELRKQADDSTFTPSPSDPIGGVASMKPSTEIRKFAAKVADTDSKLAFDMLAFADRLAEEEKKMPPWLEKKIDDKEEKKDEGKKEASDKFASLRSLVIKQAASVDASARGPWLPVLQALKDQG
jgi:hypothetical protein